MSLVKKGVSKSVIEAFKEYNNTQSVMSRFNFLNCHKGIRKGLAHGLLGTPGSGKSTLARAILSDAAQVLKCLVYITEESIKQYQAKLDQYKCNMDNVVFIQEKDIDLSSHKSLDSIILLITETLLQEDVKLFLWDNLTTSKIYESLKPNMQGYMFTKIQNFCDDNGIYFIYVAHTKQGISDNHRQMIEGEDMRGSAYPFTQSPYFWIFQRFTIDTKVYAFIHVRKHRFHEIEQKHYLLNFKDGIYYDDRFLEFSKLNEFFKLRNHLGKATKKDFKRKPDK